MTVFRLSPAVAEAFPGTLIALVTATGLRGRESWPEAAAALEDLERRLADGSWRPADETDPRIEAWHTAYRSFGTNPRRVRPSVDALGRRLAKRGCCRASTRPSTRTTPSPSATACPRAPSTWTTSSGTSTSAAPTAPSRSPLLGEPGTTETPKPGEVVYADSAGVLTRHWNHRDAHRTRVTEDSGRVTFVLETLHAARTAVSSVPRRTSCVPCSPRTPKGPPSTTSTPHGPRRPSEHSKKPRPEDF